MAGHRVPEKYRDKCRARRERRESIRHRRRPFENHADGLLLDW